MADSRKKPPDLLASVLASWPATLEVAASIELGLSGGLDSMVLLDLLWRCREQRDFHLSAVHVHHGLSPHADDWLLHCQRCCDGYGVPLRLARVCVQPAGGQSLEAVARARRYRVYQQSPAACIALAHHRNDQAETVLLQLLRGGGPHALAAMPTVRLLDDKLLWRPLLGVSRDQLQAYANQRQLHWVEDESNQDIRWRRNLLRHQVIPHIAAMIPDYHAHLERTAKLMAQAAQVLDEVGAADLATCLVEGRLDLKGFNGLSRARQQWLLRTWLRQLDGGEPTPQAIEVFCQQLATAPADRQPEMRVPGALVYRYRQQLWAERLPQVDLPAVQNLSGHDGVQTLSGGRLTSEHRRHGLNPALLAAGITLRVRQGGERLLLEVGSKPVKTLLQEAGIPPRLRARWPLLYLADGRLAAVPSVAVALDCRAEQGCWLVWEPD